MHAVAIGQRGGILERALQAAKRDRLTLRALVRRTLKTLAGLKVGRVAMALPGRDGDAVPGTATLSGRRALELVLAEIEAQPGVVSDLTLLVPPAAQKELSEILRVRASRS